MSTISSKLISYAKGRERALRSKGVFSVAKAKAVTKIMQVADYCSNMKAEQQLAFVKSIEQPILQLIPGEESRFKKLRSEILNLLTHAKS